MIGHEWVISKSIAPDHVIGDFPESFTASDDMEVFLARQTFHIDNYINPDEKLLSYFGRVNARLCAVRFVECHIPVLTVLQILIRQSMGYFPSVAVA